LKKLSISRHLAAWSVLLAISAFAHARPPAKVELFDQKTWPAITATQKEPAIVIFSATYCVHCPAVIEKLANDKAKYGNKVSLIGVVMDGHPSLKTKPPYNLVDRLFVFEGNEQAVRYTVNPDWRGVTPYTVLLSPGKAPRYIAGPPSEQDLQQFLVKGAVGFR